MTQEYKENNEMIAFLGSFLSNFYECRIMYRDIVFSSSEQLFMFLKAEYFKDYFTRDKIVKAVTPKEAKMLGRQVKDFNDEMWSLVRYEKMYIAIAFKFLQNIDIRQLLIATGDKILVEGNSADKVWGVGLDWKDPKIFDKNNWRGQNLLGNVLMRIRGELKNG